MHQVKSVIDLREGHIMRDEFIDHKLFLQIILNQFGN